MVQLKPGRAAIAGVLVGVGAALGALGLLRPGAVTFGRGAIGAALLPTVGITSLLLGFLLFAHAFRGGNDPAPSVPAHVAFARKANPTIDLQPPERPVTVTRKNTNAPPLGRSSARPAGDDAEEQIRELTRKINRAGVMLATGRLSGEGYTQYVEGLKHQRGVLEAARVYRDLSHTRP
ncbi:MAG: hypothetical protein WDA16_08445 [Candidatus Thermoplasmatota archaeon]